MILRCWLAIALLATATATRADAVVNLCATDTQFGAPGQVNLARAIEAGGLIKFNCGSSATIKFTRTHQILRTTTIDGAGRVILDGDGHRMFIGADRTFKLTDMSIINGGASLAGGLWTPGGVIRGSLNVELIRTSITRSQWAVWLHGGDLRVVNSKFSDNDGPVLHAQNLEVLDRSQFSKNRGSPIFASRGKVVIADSEFFSNTAPIDVYNCVLAISGSRLSSHTASGSGGALDLDCDATIEESEFRNNHAEHGGAIYIGRRPRTVALRAVRFFDNVAVETGGAISVETSGRQLDLTLRHVSFFNNRARYGGAVMLERFYGNTRFLMGTAVAFVRNEATENGGAIYALNAAVKLTRGVFIENHAGKGGGAIAALQQGPRITELANSLLVRNTAGSGAAFWGNSAHFINTTIADNGDVPVSAQARNALPFGPVAGTPPTFPIRFVNTIIAGSFWGGCGPPVSITPYVDAGNNLQYPGTSCGVSMASSRPFLGAYYVPLFWSPAMNAGNGAICAAAPINNKDFYNVRRPLAGANCTIGAVEADISHLINRWRKRRDVRDMATARGEPRRKRVHPRGTKERVTGATDLFRRER